MKTDKALHFKISFEDLNVEKQDEIIEEVRPGLQEMAEKSGKELLKREWHEPMPQTWQEAYVRLMAYNHISW